MSNQLNSIYSGTSRKGRTFQIRYPVMNDLEFMWKYINTLSQERTFIRYQGEEISLDDEKLYLAHILKAIDQSRCVQLITTLGTEFVGMSGVELGIGGEKHIGTFGIALAKEYRDEGIGSMLMEQVLKESLRSIPKLETITLTVDGNNDRGRHMYTKFGFKEYGLLPKGIKKNGVYVDQVYMYKHVR